MRIVPVKDLKKGDLLLGGRMCVTEVKELQKRYIVRGILDNEAYTSASYEKNNAGIVCVEVEDSMVTFELTKQQISDLYFYLMTSTQYRLGEQKTCKNLSKEVDDDGAPKYPNMKGNAEYWGNMIKSIEVIEAIIRNARLGG